MDSIPEGTRPESLHDQLVYLGDTERLELRDIPTLALHWLETIVEMGGLPDTEQVQHSGFRRVTAEDSSNSPPFEDATSVVLDNGQRLWLREGKRRSAKGSRIIEVLEEPRRIDASVLAMLTVLEGRPIKLERLREVSKTGAVPHEEYDDLVGLKLYATSLLRYFRQDFEYLSKEERLTLVEDTCARIYEFLEALRKLIDFLEYGTPDRDLRPAIENTGRDVKAAVLRDVDGLTVPKIAEELSIPISDRAKTKGDYSTVHKMIVRGRKILEGAWSEDTWRKKADAMKAEAIRWHSLAPEERVVEECAELLGVSPQEARRMLLDEKFGKDLDYRQRFVLAAAKVVYYSTER
jgi:hypothetical protein